jgi:hypothetical protein
MVWQLISLVIAGITLGLALFAIRSLRDFRTTFVIIAVWSRYVLAAFDEYTYDSLVAGLSINALSSIAVALAGLALVPPRLYLRLLYHLTPLAMLFAIIVVSGLLNAEYGGIVKDTMKWLYFSALLLLLYRAFVLFDADIVLRGLFAASLTPLALQLMSIVTGQGSFDPTVGKVVYIGGYGGSAGFSLSLLTTLCIGALINWRYSFVSLSIAVICVGGIYLAHYRTTILAALPLTAVLASLLILRWTPRVLRPLSLVYVLLGGAGAAALAVLFVPPRFLDIFIVLQSVAELMKPPELFTTDERDLFTGRVYIWAQYLAPWWAASPLVHIFGFGPEAWEGVQQKYAHNTFVSYIYEFGLVGVATLCIFFFTQLVMAARARPVSLAWRLTAALLGFLIANLATMPLWLVEGLILLAVLCALSWAKAGGYHSLTAAPAKRPIGARWVGSRSAELGPRADGERFGRLSGRSRASRSREDNRARATASTNKVST